MLLTIDCKRDLMRLTLKSLFIQMHIRACHVFRVALCPALRAKVSLTDNKKNKFIKDLAPDDSDLHLQIIAALESFH